MVAGVSNGSLAVGPVQGVGKLVETQTTIQFIFYCLDACTVLSNSPRNLMVTQCN
jgi:hypothetical protein